MKRLRIWPLLSLGFTSACGLLIELPQAELLTLDADSHPGGQANDDGSSCSSCSGGLRNSADADADDGGGTGPGGEAGAPGSCADECNCDGDSALAMSEACGGDDCDDHDPLVHPGQTVFFTKRADHAATGFDYDCSGGLERDPDQGGSTVVNCGLLGLADCPNVAQGFVGTLPACGQKGDWGGCSKLPPLYTSCVEDVMDEEAVARCH